MDGTLVDSVYQHALCWHRAFAEAGLVVPAWRCHRAIGMGGDQLVPDLAGDEVEVERGAQLRERESELFAELADRIESLPGAAGLVEALADRGIEVVLASSAEEEEVRRHIDALGVDRLIAGYTTAADVDDSKPHPELIEVALAQVGKRPAVMIGDSVWDVEAAGRAGIDCIGLLTGGFAESELRGAGAVAVFEDPVVLREHLHETPLA